MTDDVCAHPSAALASRAGTTGASTAATRCTRCHGRGYLYDKGTRRQRPAGETHADGRGHLTRRACTDCITVPTR